MLSIPIKRYVSIFFLGTYLTPSTSIMPSTACVPDALCDAFPFVGLSAIASAMHTTSMAAITSPSFLYILFFSDSVLFLYDICITSSECNVLSQNVQHKQVCSRCRPLLLAHNKTTQYYEQHNTDDYRCLLRHVVVLHLSVYLLHVSLLLLIMGVSDVLSGALFRSCPCSPGIHVPASSPAPRGPATSSAPCDAYHGSRFL